MYVDEPGLQFLFSALSGYDSMAAQSDMDRFFSMIQQPCGVHLCENPDWDFLSRREGFWDTLGKKGIDREFLVSKSDFSCHLLSGQSGWYGNRRKSL